MKLDIVIVCPFIFAVTFTLLVGASSNNIQNEPGISQVIGVLIDNNTIKITNITKSMGNLNFTSVANVSEASNLAFNTHDNSFIYTDKLNKKIWSLNIYTGNRRPIIQEGLEEPCAIVVDPLKKKFFFIDCKPHTMEMANLDGSDRKVIINGSFKEPKGIALDPIKGYLFVGDAGSNMIERFDINAEYQRTVINQNITWPNGLTLDITKERIYIVDGRSQEITSSNYDGKDLHTINNGDDLLIHAYSISHHQERLYVTDNGKSSIISYDMSGKNAMEIATNLVMPTFFEIFEMATPSKDLDNTFVLVVVGVVVFIIMIVIVAILILKRKQIVSLWKRFKVSKNLFESQHPCCFYVFPRTILSQTSAQAGTVEFCSTANNVATEIPCQYCQYIRPTGQQ